MKIKGFLTVFILFLTFLSVTSTPAFAASQSVNCFKILWFTICIPIPPKPTLPNSFPFPTRKLTPSPTVIPTMTPTPTVTPSPTVAPSPTPTLTPTPLRIGAKLNDYVQPSGSECDVNIPSDYATIQAGVSAAATDDTICVDEGTYNEDVLVNKSITLAGNGTISASIINGQTAGYGGAVRIGADNVIVEGFVINGAGTNYQNGALHIAESHSGVTVRHNRIIAGNGGLALLTDGFQTNNLIQNNLLEGNNSPHVVVVNGTPATGKASDNVDFLNNTFIGTATQSEFRDSGSVFVQHATNCSIERNIFSTTGSLTKIIDNAYGSCNYNQNNLNSVATLSKVHNGDAILILNAKNNWWGDTDPSDNIAGGVDFSPFEMSPFAEN